MPQKMHFLCVLSALRVRKLILYAKIRTSLAQSTERPRKSILAAKRRRNSARDNEVPIAPLGAAFLASRVAADDSCGHSQSIASFFPLRPWREAFSKGHASDATQTKDWNDCLPIRH